MATTKETTGEAIQYGEAFEKASEAGREYAQAVGGIALSGLKTAFELQNDTIAAWTRSVQAGQVQATNLVEASTKLIERTFETK
jgi:hypothetical protein